MKSELVLKCLDCGRDFTLTVAEQEWYQAKELSLPKRDKDCRDRRRANRQAMPGQHE